MKHSAKLLTVLNPTGAFLPKIVCGNNKLYLKIKKFIIYELNNCR